MTSAQTSLPALNALVLAASRQGVDDPVARLQNKTHKCLVKTDGIAMIEEPFSDSPFFDTIGKTFDFYADDPVQIADILRPADRMPKEVFYIPAAMLLALIVFLQRRRREAKA